MRNGAMATPEVCPNCGADVPPNAKACPACGSDDQTGWSDDARAAGLDLPEAEFDYEDFVKREFGDPSPARPGMMRFWWLVALGVLGLFLLLWLK